MSTYEIPAHVHDCDRCLFLGLYAWKGFVYDLYQCDNGPGRTVIARYSSDGPDYHSGIGLHGGDLSHPIAEAERRMPKERT